LAHGLDDPKNDFFLELSGAGTSWKAAPRHRLTGYSAHADQDTLAAWVAAMPEPPGEIRLVHGEPGAQKMLARRLNL
jgi:metallo-beta-lactamase family protein